jgi:hypothetical protein
MSSEGRSFLTSLRNIREDSSTSSSSPLVVTPGRVAVDLGLLDPGQLRPASHSQLPDPGRHVTSSESRWRSSWTIWARFFTSGGYRGVDGLFVSGYLAFQGGLESPVDPGLFPPEERAVLARPDQPAPSHDRLGRIDVMD